MSARSLAWWLEWPRGVGRIGVMFLVATTATAVVIAYPSLMVDAERDASTNSNLSFTDREIAGGNGVVPDQAAVYAARALIPENDAFSVSVHPSYDAGSELTVPYVASYYRYALLPRRMVEGGRWVVCYACDVAQYEGAEVVWEGTDDTAILRRGTP